MVAPSNQTNEFFPFSSPKSPFFLNAGENRVNICVALLATDHREKNTGHRHNTQHHTNKKRNNRFILSESQCFFSVHFLIGTIITKNVSSALSLQCFFLSESLVSSQLGLSIRFFSFWIKSN